MQELTEQEQKKIIETKIEKKNKTTIQRVKKKIKTNWDQFFILAFSFSCSIFGTTSTIAIQLIVAGDWRNATYAAIIAIASVILGSILYTASLFCPPGELTEDMQKKLLEYLRKKAKTQKWAGEIFKTISGTEK